jgi:hypothetical protein
MPIKRAPRLFAFHFSFRNGKEIRFRANETNLHLLRTVLHTVRKVVLAQRVRERRTRGNDER